MQNALQMQRGSVAGTGAALSIECGFIPRKVKLFNTAAGGLCTLDWNDSMPDGYGFKRITAGTATYITTNGITKGTRTTLLGFIIGADADINVNTENIFWEAYE